jgi:hypothetical protein
LLWRVRKCILIIAQLLVLKGQFATGQQILSIPFMLTKNSDGGMKKTGSCSSGSSSITG